MDKSFILLICLFGLSCLYQASAAAPKQCAIGYYDVPAPPVCTWVTGPDGKKHQECTSVGSAAFGAALDKNQKTLKEPNFPFNDLDFSGYCSKCTLTVYSKANYKGYSLSYAFSKSKAKHIYNNKLWKRATKSFKVVCTF